jgi:hypothetical protein
MDSIEIENKPDLNNESILKPKRKRRTKKTIEEEKLKNEKKIPKKRGRKPKGGKILQVTENKNLNTMTKENVILHLKCKEDDIHKTSFLSEIKYTPHINDSNNIIYYDIEDKYLSNFVSSNHIELSDSNNNHVVLNNNNSHNKQLESTNTTNNSIFNQCSNINSNNNNISCKNDIPNKSYVGSNINDNTLCFHGDKSVNTIKSDEQSENIQMNEIWEKVRKLRKLFYHSSILNKKSKCFWCTYNFNNTPIYLPKSKIDEEYEVYGYFCTPECAVGYLFHENIDNSTKWERYALMNALYCNIFKYKTNIKPAPEPRYILDKYFGNISIEEYRKMNSKHSNIMILDKPITRILPEISMDTDDIDIRSRFQNKGDMTSVSSYRLSRNFNSNDPISTNSSKMKSPNKDIIMLNKQFWKDIKH